MKVARVRCRVYPGLAYTGRPRTAHSTRQTRTLRGFCRAVCNSLLLEKPHVAGVQPAGGRQEPGQFRVPGASRVDHYIPSPWVRWQTSWHHAIGTRTGRLFAICCRPEQEPPSRELNSTMLQAPPPYAE